MLSALTYTDRSRYETRIGKCAREEYLTYHFGPFGYGIQSPRTRLPLATGAVIHQGIAAALYLCSVRGGRVITPGEIQTAVDVTRQAYEQYATAGLTYWQADEYGVSQQALVAEQLLLCEGLTRAFLQWQMPAILRDWELVYVEEEAVTVLDCTCELGDRVRPWTAHVDRGCTGFGFTSRGDFLARHRQSRIFSYHELKTLGQYFDTWRRQWEFKIQPQLGTFAAEDHFGIAVEQTFVHGLNKGRRIHAYVPGKGLVGAEYQDSRLVHAFRSLQGPATEWAVTGKWYEPDGTEKRLPKHFTRTPVSEYGDYETYLTQFRGDLEPQILCSVGPLPRRQEQRDAVITGWLHAEREKRAALWAIYDLIERQQVSFYAPDVQDILDRVWPPSYECNRYGKKHLCQFVPVCHRHPGWDQPIELLGFKPRQPHHAPEFEQAVARGCLPADMLSVDGDGDE